MDTRKKILKLEDGEEILRHLAASGSRIKVVTGLFDPLTAGHVRRLELLKDGRSLVVAVVTKSGLPILPDRARAELVAALSCVDYVILATGEAVETWLARVPAVEIIRDEEVHQVLQENLVRHVRSRQERR